MSIDIKDIKVGDTVTIYRSAFEEYGGRYHTGKVVPVDDWRFSKGVEVDNRCWLLGHPANRIVSHTPAPEPTPEWADALLIQDREGFFWGNNGQDGWSQLGNWGPGVVAASEGYISKRGPITMIIDKDGRNLERYEENERGGEARYVVAEAAKILGFDLFDDDMIGELWDPKNMARILPAIQELNREAGDLAKQVTDLKSEARVAYVRGAKDALAIVKEECARGEERFRHRPEYLNGRSFGLWFTGGRIEELINKAEAQQ
jgi:hypothetical protein